MEQTEHKNFDALMSMARFRNQYRDSRRTVEWRGTFAAWALLLGIAATLKEATTCLVFPMVLLIFLAHAWWVKYNFERNDRDAKALWAYYHAARILIPGDSPEPRDTKGDIDKPPDSQLRPALILATAVLGAFVVLFNIFHEPQNNQPQKASASSTSQQSN